MNLVDLGNIADLNYDYLGDQTPCFLINDRINGVQWKSFDFKFLILNPSAVVPVMNDQRQQILQLFFPICSGGKLWLVQSHFYMGPPLTLLLVYTNHNLSH